MYRKLISLLFLLASGLYAALPSTTTTWEIQPTSGNNANAGCFVAGSSGTDLTYPTSSPVAFTDFVIGGTTTQLTSVAHPFGATDVGNCVKVASGSGCTTGIYYVVSVASTTATMDRSVGTAASTCSGNKGGALQSIGQFHTNGAAGNVAYMKAEATVTTSAGEAVFFVGSAGVMTQLVGYSSTRGDNGKVTIQATATGIKVLASGTLSFVARNFILDANNQSNTWGYQFNTTQNAAYDIDVKNITGASAKGFGWSNQKNICIRCTVNTGASGAIAFDFGSNGFAYCWFCVANGTNTTGFQGSTDFTCNFCISANNTGVSSDGFAVPSGFLVWIMNSVACGNGRDGIRYTSANFGTGIPPTFMNNILTGNGGFGINMSGFTPPVQGFMSDYNAYYNNTSGAYNSVTAGPHDITMTATPFNCAGVDFTLNSTAGGGAAVKAKGYPGVQSLGGTGYIDIGALQSQAPAASTGGAYGIVQ